MISSQKIEVGHISQSKNASAFLLFKPSEIRPGTLVSINFENFFGPDLLK